MIKQQQVSIVNYLVVCVNEFATRFNLSSKEAYNYLSRHNGISFLIENYEIEHTISLEDVLDDMVIICRKNGGTLS